jgi:hypothetical protein
MPTRLILAQFDFFLAFTTTEGLTTAQLDAPNADIP